MKRPSVLSVFIAAMFASLGSIRCAFGNAIPLPPTREATVSSSAYIGGAVVAAAVVISLVAVVLIRRRSGGGR